MKNSLDSYAYSLARVRWDVFGTLTFRSVPSPKRAFGRAWAHMHQAAEIVGRPYSQLLIVLRAECGEMMGRFTPEENNDVLRFTKTESDMFFAEMSRRMDGMRGHRTDGWKPGDLVFPQGIPRACRLKKDAERLEIAYRDEQGRYADFHALRYTWATFLQRNGVGQRVAMKLMRHSDMKLTAKVYTDESQLPVRESIQNLPRLGYTQIRAQISGANGQNGSQADARVEGIGREKSPAIDGVCLGLAALDVGSELERAKGFEPSTFTLAR